MVTRIKYFRSLSLFIVLEFQGAGDFGVMLNSRVQVKFNLCFLEPKCCRWIFPYSNFIRHILEALGMQCKLCFISRGAKGNFFDDVFSTGRKNINP